MKPSYIVLFDGSPMVLSHKGPEPEKGVLLGGVSATMFTDLCQCEAAIKRTLEHNNADSSEATRKDSPWFPRSRKQFKVIKAFGPTHFEE